MFEVFVLGYVATRTTAMANVWNAFDFEDKVTFMKAKLLFIKE